MNLKTSKKMRGLMCHSPAATAVCIPGDPRSVIVPRRPDRTLVDHSTLINNAKYSRLVESHRFSPAPKTKRSVLLPATKRDLQPNRDPIPFHHPPPSAPSLDDVFQVRFMTYSIHHFNMVRLGYDIVLLLCSHGYSDSAISHISFHT